jgi:hypothetical protein
LIVAQQLGRVSNKAHNAGPEGHLIVAQRFIAGKAVVEEISPVGTTDKSSEHVFEIVFDFVFL